MKKLVLASLIAMSLLSTGVSANIFENYVPNLMGGINLSGITGAIDTDLGLGFQIGTSHEILINELPVMLSAKMINRNSSYKESQTFMGETSTIKAEMSRTNVEIAAEAKFKVGEGVVATVGPYAGLPIFQNSEATITSMGESYTMDDDGAFEGLEIGLLFGGSFVYEGYNVQANYQLGLNDIADGDAKTTGFTFSVGKPI